MTSVTFSFQNTFKIKEVESQENDLDADLTFDTDVDETFDTDFEEII